MATARSGVLLVSLVPPFKGVLYSEKGPRFSGSLQTYTSKPIVILRYPFGWCHETAVKPLLTKHSSTGV